MNSSTQQADGSKAPAGFTLIELLAVISIIGLLAAIGAGLAGVGMRKAREANVRAELGKLVTGVEAYKADLGQYPPDNAKAGVNFSSALNQLYYELIGTVSLNQGREYRTSDREATVKSTEIQYAFNVQGFVNAAADNQRPKNYLPNLKLKQRREVNLGSQAQTLELLAAPVDWPLGAIDKSPLAPTLAGQVTDPALRKRQLQINPWQYVSTRPTNNPAAFDLWAEVVIGKERKVIGNWSQ